MSGGKFTADKELLDWLDEEIVNVIELDDGRLIDVHGGDVRKAIRAAIARASGDA